MAHIELQLLSSLIEYGEMKTVIEEGITVDIFSQPEARAIFESIMTYYQGKDTRNIVPNWDWIYKRFPVVDFPRPSKRLTTRALCIETKQNWLKRRLEDLLASVSDIYETEPVEALTELFTTCKSLQTGTSKSRDIVLSDSMEEVRRQYFLAKDSTGYSGIPYPTGWGYHTENGEPKILKRTGRQDHPLNEQTRGKQNGEFILIYGRPKCVVADQRLLTPSGMIKIKDASKKITTVASIDEQKIKWGKCHIYSVGKKEAVLIITRNSYSVKVSIDHLMMVPNMRFVRAGKLQIGEYVGVVNENKLEHLLDQHKFSTKQNDKTSHSDINWEEIIKIEKLGEKECYDVTMCDSSRPVFLVENFVTHNSMKTWLLIDMAVEDYMHNHCRTLIFTKEMTPEQIRTRFVARMLGVNYLAFKNGELSESEEDDFLSLVSELKEEEERFKKDGKRCSLLITTGWTGKDTTNDLVSLDAKIEEFEPQVVYVDAIYLFETVKNGKSQIHQEVKQIAYGLKSIAYDRNVPIIATSQANRKGEETKGSTLSEIAYGDSLGQACDLALRIIKRELEGGIKLACIISGGREVILPGFLLTAEPASCFQLDQIFESQRQIQAQFKAEEEMIAAEEARAAKKMQGGSIKAHMNDWK